MKPKLLIVSAVYPFPRQSGQQQRVYYKLKALKERFDLTFLTVSSEEKINEVEQNLLKICDHVIVLPSRYSQNFIDRLWHRLIGFFHSLFTGLKFSNYLIGEVELSPQRIRAVLNRENYDGALFEYWHAYKTARMMKSYQIPTILDMHDILWLSYTRQWEDKKWAPSFLKSFFISKYKNHEEEAWHDFDMLIAINEEELIYARETIKSDKQYFYAPMGTDISTWPYCYEPIEHPRRIAYYGGLGSSHNQQDALLCYETILPIIWEVYPEIEFWIIGSKPPDFIRNLSTDSRVHVTGYVDNVQDVLKTMSLVLCPWSGTYGFRSRIVEVMSLGVPIVASHDAVYGMGFDAGNGIHLGETPGEMAKLVLSLLENESGLPEQSQMARQQIAETFSYEATYVRFANELFAYLSKNNSRISP